jgi:hypothetical protein
VLQPHEYKRDIDIFKHYLNHNADYLATMTGRPKNECLDYIRRNLRPDGRFPFKDPKIQYLERQDNGDRELKEGTLYWYISTSIKEGDIIAPTLTTYLHPKKKKSLLAIFINGNVKRRSKAKKEMFAAKMAKDTVLAAFKDLEQTNAKQKNNSLSGAHNSSSTPLFNKTAHSTLTSTCRSTSGYGNANNEKFLAGNRHYWSPAIVVNNIMSIKNHTDYELLASVMKKYGLKEPSVADMMNCIRHSTKHYFVNDKAMMSIAEFAAKLTGLERAAFVYTGDLYHIKELNPDFVHMFLTRLAKRVNDQHGDPVSVFKSCFEDQRNLATQICQDVTKGIAPADLAKHPEVYGVVAATIENIDNTVLDYADFIKAFFVTENVPASMAWLPDSIRHVALTSDTDSTIFTVQDWVKWHHGKISFNNECMGLAATMIYLASATITHVLARMSANFGVDESMIHQIAMKNEYKFDVFVPTQVGKHYYADISCQEGNVYSEYVPEIKGVHLKNSNVSKQIMAKAKDMMVSMMETVMRDEQIDLQAILKQVGDTERHIIQAIKEGSHDYFKYGRVNPAESYKQGADAAPYKQYLMWEEVFAPKYGSVPPPPYTCLKLSIDLDSSTKVRDWLDSLEDRDLAQRMRSYMLRNMKSTLGTAMQIPEQIILSHGIPEELIKATNINKIVMDQTSVFYIILETLGIYMRDEVMVHHYY